MQSLIFILLLFPSSLCVLGDNCPSNEHNNLKILWTDYASFYIKEESNGTMTGIFPRIMKKSLKKCCAHLNSSFVKAEYHTNAKHVADFYDEIEKANSFDTIYIIFPSLSAINDPSTFSHFIPIKNSPGPMILASTESLENDADWFFFQMWLNPVLYLILVSSISAGVLFWMMEFRGTENKAHSPFTNLIREMGNSIWFSIVTLSTVGYGDIVPRNPVGKLHAIVWMLTGTVLTSLFTAHISSSMTALTIDENKSLLKKKLGVIQGTRMFFENEMNFGAVMSEYKEDDIFKALEQGNVSRLLLPDFLEAMYYLTNSHRQHFHENFRIVNNIRHPFSLGISIVTDNQNELGSFMSCLRLWLKWSYIQDNDLDYSEIDDNFIKTHSLEVLGDKLLIRMTYYAIIICAVLLGLCMIGCIVKKLLQRRLRKTELTSIDKNEMKT